MVRVCTFKEGKMTGEMRGFADQSLAEIWICAHRNSRDTDPVWIHFKKGDYDWHVIEFNDDDSFTILY